MANIQHVVDNVEGTIGITVFNVKEESTLNAKAEKTSLKQALNVIVKNDQQQVVTPRDKPEPKNISPQHRIVKNDQLLAFIGLLLTFNLCTQILKAFAVYYFKEACGNAYLYSIFGYGWCRRTERRRPRDCSR